MLCCSVSVLLSVLSLLLVWSADVAGGSWGRGLDCIVFTLSDSCLSTTLMVSRSSVLVWVDPRRLLLLDDDLLTAAALRLLFWCTASLTRSMSVLLSDTWQCCYVITCSHQHTLFHSFIHSVWGVYYRSVSLTRLCWDCLSQAVIRRKESALCESVLKWVIAGCKSDTCYSALLTQLSVSCLSSVKRDVLIPICCQTSDTVEQTEMGQFWEENISTIIKCATLLRF